MHIVLVNWKIIPGEESDFELFWKTKVKVEDRSKMVGEYLSKVEPASAFNWITWDLEGAGYTPYINVGIWADANDFHDQIKAYFKPTNGKADFEHELRTRALLAPELWRTGQFPLPSGDSPGVL